MEKNNFLINMTDFVINKRKELLRHSEYKNDLENYANIIYKYARFLKQLLNLGMFVPCDKIGNVLVEPNPKEIYPTPTAEEEIDFLDCLEQYQQAKEKVLFEGFEIDKNLHLVYRDEISIGRFISYKNESKFIFRDSMKTIEDLVEFGFKLTESTLKQIEQ